MKKTPAEVSVSGIGNNGGQTTLTKTQVIPEKIKVARSKEIKKITEKSTNISHQSYRQPVRANNADLMCRPIPSTSQEVQKCEPAKVAKATAKAAEKRNMGTKKLSENKL